MRSLNALCGSSAGGTQGWRKYQHDVAAFVLPLGPAYSSKKALETFGTRKATQVFAGGGPFIEPDSPQLAVSVMTRLGYLDDFMNADLGEALMVFVNNTINKRNLRKAEALPASTDTHEDSLQNIRRVLLQSPGGRGSWGVAPRDGTVRQMLLAEGPANL